jgi:hypothetical protein
MTGITIPQSFTFTFDVPLDLDLKGGVAVTLLGDPAHPVSANAKIGLELVGDPQRPIAAKVGVELVGDPRRPVAAKVDASMMLANLPVFPQAFFDKLVRWRVRFPVNFRFGMSVFPFNLFGVDVVQLSLCGEPQVILDDYVPNAYERCEIECEPCEA